MSQGIEIVSLYVPARGQQVVELQGFPSMFWVVTKPTNESEIGDICFLCNILEFVCQIKGGIKEESIHGFYNNGKTARGIAQKLLDARN